MLSVVHMKSVVLECYFDLVYNYSYRLKFDLYGVVFATASYQAQSVVGITWSSISQMGYNPMKKLKLDLIAGSVCWLFIITFNK